MFGVYPIFRHIQIILSILSRPSSSQTNFLSLRHLSFQESDHARARGLGRGSIHTDFLSPFPAVRCNLPNSADAAVFYSMCWEWSCSMNIGKKQLHFTDIVIIYIYILYYIILYYFILFYIILYIFYIILYYNIYIYYYYIIYLCSYHLWSISFPLSRVAAATFSLNFLAAPTKLVQLQTVGAPFFSQVVSEESPLVVKGSATKTSSTTCFFSISDTIEYHPNKSIIEDLSPLKDCLGAVFKLGSIRNLIIWDICNVTWKLIL